MSRLMVVGDVHGNLRALDQVLERAAFNAGEDRLIFLGDVCDGWPEVGACIERLQEIGAECIWGNHDVWTWEWMLNAIPQRQWITQGGRATYEDMDGDPVAARKKYGAYFDALKDYIHDAERGFLFVHGGIPANGRIGGLPDRQFLTWDRDLFTMCAHSFMASTNEDKPLTNFKKVFLGHTTTERFSEKPVEWRGVVLLDQGGGWTGKLSIMDADTGEYWQSDNVAGLYPEHGGGSAA